MNIEDPSHAFFARRPMGESTNDTSLLLQALKRLSDLKVRWYLMEDSKKKMTPLHSLPVATSKRLTNTELAINLTQNPSEALISSHFVLSSRNTPFFKKRTT